MPRSRVLFTIAAAAFVLRLIAGLLRGPEFAETGYTINALIAQNWWSGGGLCVADGRDCAVRLPLYPVLIAPFVSTGTAYPWLLIVQSLIGAGLSLLTFALASTLFTERVGLMAAVLVAIDPYSVIHSTALQDTVVVDSLAMSLAVLLVLAHRRADLRLVAAAGVLASLLLLTSARITPFVVLSVGWVAVYPPAPRVKSVLTMLLPIALLVGPWLARNAYVVGAPVLTTEMGYSLWKVHNPIAMTVFPSRSIDGIDDVVFESMTPDDQRRVDDALTPVARDRALGRIAFDYIRHRPIASLRDGLIRAGHGLFGSLAPYRAWPIQVGYSLVFLPATVLALVSLWRGGASPPNVLIILAFVSVIATAAMFWAYTSHRSYLHAFEFACAASVVEQWLARWPRKST